MWWLRSPILLLPASVLATCVSPSAAGPPAELSPTSFHIGAPAGIRRLRPETWGLVAVDVVNAGDQPADVITEGDMLPEGSTVRVIQVRGNRLVVALAPPDDTAGFPSHSPGGTLNS